MPPKKAAVKKPSPAKVAAAKAVPKTKRTKAQKADICHAAGKVVGKAGCKTPASAQKLLGKKAVGANAKERAAFCKKNNLVLNRANETCKARAVRSPAKKASAKKRKSPKKASAKKRKSPKKSPLKKCTAGEVRNPVTKRCIKRNCPAHKKLLAARKASPTKKASAKKRKSPKKASVRKSVRASAYIRFIKSKAGKGMTTKQIAAEWRAKKSPAKKRKSPKKASVRKSPKKASVKRRKSPKKASAKKRKSPKKASGTKRPLNAYQKYVKSQGGKGLTFAQIAAQWRAKK